MKLFNILRFTQNKYNYFEYIILSILIITILHRFNNIFSNRTLVALFTTIFIIYWYFQYNSQQIFDDFKKYKYKIDLIKNLNLRYLEKDWVILNIYDSILHFKNFNPEAFNLSMQNMNVFLQNYSMASNSNNVSKYLYDSAVWRRSESMNQLMSVIVTIPRNAAFYNGKQSDIEFNSIYEQKLLKAIEDLRKTTLKYLHEIEDILNKRWDKGIIYNYSSPIYSGDPMPNPYRDKLFSKNYSIF